MRADRLPGVRRLRSRAAQADVIARIYTQTGYDVLNLQNMLQLHDVPDMFMVPRCARSPSRCSQTAHDGDRSMTDKVPILVVLGIDVDGKPHGSRFNERDAPFVERAAGADGFSRDSHRG
jgi:hypothetical protein